METILSLGVSPKRIIYTNPHKQNSHLLYARDKDIDILVFDCEEELNKLHHAYPKARYTLNNLILIEQCSNYIIADSEAKSFLVGCQVKYHTLM